MKSFIVFILMIVSVFFISAQDASSDGSSGAGTSSTERKVKDGWDYFSEGKYLESLKALEEEKKLYPSRINIYLIMGWDYKNLKRYPEMEKVSLEGYNLNPTHIHIIKNLGESYFFQGKYSEAIKYLEKFLKYRSDVTDPNVPIVYYFLGYCYYETGLYYKADSALSAAKGLGATNAYVYYVLAKTNEKLNNNDKALALYEAAYKLNAEITDAKAAIDRLSSKK